VAVEAFPVHLLWSRTVGRTLVAAPCSRAVDHIQLSGSKLEAWSRGSGRCPARLPLPKLPRARLQPQRAVWRSSSVWLPLPDLPPERWRVYAVVLGPCLLPSYDF